MNKQPKKKLAARLYDAIFQPEKMNRHYAAAKASRLNAGWSTIPTGVNWETRVSLPALIARSRQAARDDLHIVNYLRLMRANVIGCEGIQLQSNARSPRGKLNVKLNAMVEDAWSNGLTLKHAR
jgi:capsid protein